ncbi:ATP-binding protein [Parashewanella spongiae]|uniref:endopeptidase La n=1 Tax=Parashewanella spongiae TaxID=342950 RepID=A0A3A6TG46_9GAMM|nr:ATP-binding protein [Parashewanella spongiae]MCL1079152.1 AAA family ATPase [Parashewanella spongiae]RJY10756.1 ATP-binding protein [Parashewanella spongiae]
MITSDISLLSSISPVKKLTKQDVYRPCQLPCFTSGCLSTDDLQPINDIVGQTRAQKAVEFAMGIKEKGYNIYAIGQNGLGKRTMMLRYLTRLQSERELFDWCYVGNFDDTRSPKVLKLPRGQAVTFKQNIEKLVLRLVKALPLAFDNEMYFNRADQLKKQLSQQQEAALEELTKEAKAKNVKLLMTAQGDYQLIAVNGEEPHTEESYEALPADEKKAIEKIVAGFETRLRQIVRTFTKWEQEYSDKQQEHDDQTAKEVLSQFIKPLLRKYKKDIDVSEHLKAMQKDMIANVDIFLEQSEEQLGLAYATLDKKMPRRYLVNVLVNQKDTHFPIQVEESPSYHSLFGYIENATFKGTVFTDFSLIRAGSLHQANGGVLLIDATKVLERPYVWDGLKRALRSRQLDLNSLEREVSLSGTISMNPEPIPLNVKIIMFGDHQTYQLLQHYDPDFSELFRVTADFETSMPRTDTSEEHYARFISSIVHDNELLPCDNSAIARVVEYSSRQAEDQNKLSLYSADIANLLRETSFVARSQHVDMITANHVQQALDNQQHRVNKLQDSLLDDFKLGRTLMQVTGKVVGQVNALTVLSTAEYRFGLPSRITANTALGKGEVLDVEHKVKLGGQIHTKGVLILTSYLASMLGKSAEIPLTTYLTFEQSYSGVDGDSASMAEYCAILSAISKIPLKQSIAITGSMDQFGVAQPIGGVNEKIEGFYDVCSIKGRHDEQGVIIPAANIENLMIRSDIAEAIHNGKFHIWAISHINQAIELLAEKASGVSKGQSFTKNSVYQSAHLKLQKLRTLQQKK